jgi:F0F1-type ATP synthase membrane subunit b/b'
MSEKNIDEAVDKLEENVAKYASADTVISIGGYSFTPAKLMIAGGIVSTILGGLYGAFEVYKDYMDMKAAISEYVAPDLSGINERISVMEKEMQATKSSVMEATEYTNEIKNDLKRDIRRVEGIVESAERATKESARETMQDVKDVRNELKSLSKEVDDKIKKALDNPLANQ